MMETAYAFTDQDNNDFTNIADQALVVQHYPYTPEGPRDMLRNVMSIVRVVDNGPGLGVSYWDATWTAVEGNGWDSTNPVAGNI